MRFCEVLQPYYGGKLNFCLEFFNEYSSETSRKLDLHGLDVNTQSYLFENNAIVCEAILSRTNLNWSDFMDRFIKLHSRYRSLPVPLDLELNIVYNLLWWYSIKYDISEQQSLYFRTVMDITSTSMIKVMKFCGEAAYGQKQCHDMTRLLNQLNLATDGLLRLPPVCSLQLLGVTSLVVLLLLRHHSADYKATCMCLTRKWIDQVDLLTLHMQQKVISNNEEIYFKFGLNTVNSTASIKNLAENLDAFFIVMSLVYTVNGEFKLAMDYLKPVAARETCSFIFLVNYVKAYCHYHLQQYNEAKLCLAYSSSAAVSQYEGHYRLLLARLLAEQGDSQAALVQCEAVLSSRPGLASYACHLAATVTHTTAHLLYLNKLVESLKPSTSKESSKFEGFEECCLTILCEQFTVTLQEALYLLARQLYLSGYHIKALDRYRELLELLRSGSVDRGITKLLPRKLQILHETVLAHIKANNLKEGEQLCHQLIREFAPTSAKGVEGESSWEGVLYGLEDDIISMTLLADILLNVDKKKAVDELNRCYNALSESRGHAGSDPVKSGSLKELCDWFMCRILLRKAKLSRPEDTVHYFRRALMHKPGDKEVIFHYKQWALWNPDHESFDAGELVTEFPVDQIHSLALSYLLGCSVTEEEWTALFDQESSQNVLESLFDDDD